jgi:hypothetical protein
MQGLNSAVFKLNQTRRYPDSAFENDTAAYVVRWEDKKDIDESKFKEEKDKYAESILSMKQQYVFAGWLERLMAKAEIDRSSFAKNK